MIINVMNVLHQRGSAAALGRTAFVATLLLAVGPARADDFGLPFDQLKHEADGLADALKLHAEPGKAPDFVRQSRPDPARLQFRPVGLPHPVRALPLKTPVEIAKLKAALAAAAAAQLKPRGLLNAPLDLTPKTAGRSAEGKDSAAARSRASSKR
jgi:hypothetical protein